MSKWTEEQLKIINNTDDLLVVNAVAGSGKTSTLMGIALKNRSKKVLYLVFNSAMKKEAEEKFRSARLNNITVKTGHGLAYSEYSMGNVEKGLDLPNIAKRYEISYVDARYLIEVYQKFLQSRSKTISEFIKENIDFIDYKYNMKERIVKKVKPFIMKNEIKYRRSLGELDRSTIYGKVLYTFIELKLKLDEIGDSKLKNVNMKTDTLIYNAIDLNWEDLQKDEILQKSYEKIESRLQNMFDLMCEGKLPQIHDHYLKLYQLYKKPEYNYDIVLLDEAQDSNDVMIDIMETKFLNARKIVVGDTNQQIYRWRGAVNAMEYFKALPESITLELTNSFRFGDELADLAKRILSYKEKDCINIKGLNQTQKVVKSLNSKHQMLVLGRTNAGLFKYAIENLDKKLYFIRTIDFTVLEEVLGMYLNEKQKLKTNELKRYGNYDNLEKAIEEKTELNSEIVLSTALVNKYKEKLRVLIDKMKKQVVFSRENCDIILSTIHSAKGMEHSNIYILDDFADLDEASNILKNSKHQNPSLYTRVKRWYEEEINIMYVAVTRSKGKLHHQFDLKRI